MAAPLQPSNSAELPTATVPATTITWSFARPNPRRRKIFLGAGVAVALLLGAVVLLSRGGEPEAMAPATTPTASEGPAQSGPTTAPSAAATPPAAVTASLPAKTAEPAAEASVDAGAPPDAGAEAPAHPQVPIKKRRNFGY